MRVRSFAYNIHSTWNCAEHATLSHTHKSDDAELSIIHVPSALSVLTNMEVWEKSQTVDPEVRAYIYSLVNAVGGTSTIGEAYSVGDDALAALHDIVRWLKLYDEKLRRDGTKLEKPDVKRILTGCRCQAMPCGSKFGQWRSRGDYGLVARRANGQQA